MRVVGSHLNPWIHIEMVNLSLNAAIVSTPEYVLLSIIAETKQRQSQSPISFYEKRWWLHNSGLVSAAARGIYEQSSCSLRKKFQQVSGSVCFCNTAVEARIGLKRESSISLLGKDQPDITLNIPDIVISIRFLNLGPQEATIHSLLWSKFTQKLG